MTNQPNTIEEEIKKLKVCTTHTHSKEGKCEIEVRVLAFIKKVQKESYLKGMDAMLKRFDELMVTREKKVQEKERERAVKVIESLPDSHEHFAQMYLSPKQWKDKAIKLIKND